MTQRTTGTCRNCGKPIRHGNYFRDGGPQTPRWFHDPGTITCATRRLPEEQNEGTWPTAEPEQALPARIRLLGALVRGTPMLTVDAAALVDAYAHELAEQDGNDMAALVAVGRLYLTAIDNDPDHQFLTAGEALNVTYVREAVERYEARR